VVLPFQNMSGDPEHEYFADGMVEEITTAVSRIRWLFVIARNSAFTYKGRAVDVRQVGRELGVRYVLEGSVRRAGARVRIAAQLAEAETGHHIWADRFDGDLSDVFDLQDRVTEAVAGAMEPSLRAVEIARARRKPAGSLDAYDLYLRALPHFFALTPEGNAAALTLLRRAITLDAGYAPAWGRAAFCHVRAYANGWDTPQDSAAGVALAREAVALGRDEPTALACAAHALGYLACDHAGAAAAVRRALALNANSAEVRLAAGLVGNWRCDAAAALEHLGQAIRLSPLDPDMALLLTGLGIAHLIAGRDEEALAFGERALQEAPGFVPGHRVVVAALHGLGRPDDAAAAARRWRQATPGSARVMAARMQAIYVRPEVADRLVRACREAGLPE
jgi:adenylate cyclase